MIVDCFTFFNEFQMLEARLAELDPYVDRFVVVEGDRTHAGEPKPYYFFEDIHWSTRWERWKRKIISIRAQLPECTGDRWVLENTQRNAILHGLQGVNTGDYVLIGDVDEIPNMSSWNGQEGVFRGPAYFYRVNLQHKDAWNGTVAVRAWRFASEFGRIVPQDCRNFRDLISRCGHGKHFSWMGDPMVKVKSFAHKELDNGAFQPDLSVHPGDKSPLVKVDMDEGWFPESFKTERFKEWRA